MLVDKNIYSLWYANYGAEKNELKRFGVVDDTGESKVELYLKTFNIYAVPNKVFKLDKGKEGDQLTSPIYISKCATVEDLKKKVARVLSTHLYFNVKDKSVMVKDVRLWKGNYEDHTKVRELDKKFTNYTSVEIDGELMNKSPEDLKKKLYEVNISDDDLLIVEMPKNNTDYVFTVAGE